MEYMDIIRKIENTGNDISGGETEARCPLVERNMLAWLAEYITALTLALVLSLT
jgi:hypothetical protein